MVSVILPIYKEKIEWIKLSVESILSQTYREFELLLINDNPDNIDNINLIKAYEKLDKRVIGIFHEENMGLPKSLNHAIKLSKGEYIARMDADDISLPNRFEEQVKYLNNNSDIGIVGSYAVLIDENNKTSNKMNVYENNETLKAMTLFGNPFIHPVVMLRRNLLLENPYDENCTIWQDRELWCRLKDKTNFYNVPKILIKYRISSFHAPQKAGKRKAEESRKYCANKIFDHWKIDRRHKETYVKVVSGEKIDDVTLNSFFMYLLSEYPRSEIRYFTLKQYMKYLSDNNKFRILYNPLILDFPLVYTKALIHSFIRLINKYI